MPGVVMDSGSRNGSHTNHDRDQQSNGVNGERNLLDNDQEKGKGKEPQQNMTPTSPTRPNLLNGMGASLPSAAASRTAPADLQERVQQLPPEIAHITQGFLPLSTLLTRFSQKTHKEITTLISELAQMPLPAAAVNGNASHASIDDNSAENVNKKLRLLTVAEKAHSEWTKLYVVTSWSRNSEGVRKLIDLKNYLAQQAGLYDDAINRLGQFRVDLGAARIPNPDLKTAVQVLSTGKAPWMPEFHYIQPPPMLARDVINTLDTLNTLLSERLNLHEYDRIPWQFKDYTIKSGRATFRVAGEFEVDLGIADEDPKNQFWFIDIRFLFSPSPTGLPIAARKHLEDRSNVALKDGLLGCYHLLHEMVLTHKISEFRRQAMDLARGKWIKGLKVEPLNRSLSIQYWVGRYAQDSYKSWIILGVHSGKRKEGRPSPKSISHLFIRWFRNGKEVKDVDIPFDVVNISAVSLLKTVIAAHVNFILTSIFEKLQTNPIFAKREADLNIFTSSNEPAESILKVQLTKSEHLSISVDPITGRFLFGQESSTIARMMDNLNFKSRDPAFGVHTFIENLRAWVVTEDFSSHGASVGWIRDPTGPSVKGEDLTSKTTKIALQTAWFRRASWLQNWWALLRVGVDGERWFLLETANTTTGTTISVAFEMAVSGVSSTPTHDFMSRLSTYAAAQITLFVNLKKLHSLRARYKLQETSPVSRIRVPYILMRLSDLLPSKNKSPRTKKPWAKDSVKVVFQSLEPGVPEEFFPFLHRASPLQPLGVAKAKAKGGSTPAATPPAVVQQQIVQLSPNDAPKQFCPGETAVIMTEARMTVPVPQALAVLKERVDRDIAFDAKSGGFAFQLKSKIGETIIPAFIERAIRVERLVDFIEVLHKHERILKCEHISLGRIIFTYGNAHPPNNALDVDGIDCYEATIDFGSTDSNMTLTLNQGNPHVRIVDNLTKVLNEGEGLEGVVTLLPLTLPALRALDTLEGAWALLSAKGEALVFVRAVEWFVIRYTVFSSTPRKVIFEIKLRQRKGEPWWHIKRIDSRDREGDDIDASLKPVWNSNGIGWQGMRIDAVAQPAGMEDLIGKLDEVMRSVASNVEQAAPTPAPVVGQAKPQQRAPEAPMMGQQLTQQPTPSHSQSQSQVRNTPSQSQGRGTPQNQGRNTPQQSQGQSQGQKQRQQGREIVEID